MKALYLKVKNIGIIEDGEIEFNKPLILLYGEIRQGKTTYLNAIRWVCGGEFPSDIIRHGAKEAEIEFGFDGGMIRRGFYVSKKEPHETRAREVQFIKNGRPVERPVGEIKRMLNPFLLNQDYLRNMGETDRKKYFTETFVVDTTELDTEAFNAGREASRLRDKLTGYGDLDLAEVKPVDVTALKKSLDEIRTKNKAAQDKWSEEYRAAQAAQDAKVKARADAVLSVDSCAAKREQCKERISEIQTQVSELQKKQKECKDWLVKNPELAPPAAVPDFVFVAQPKGDDTAELETKIQNAAVQNVRAEQYQKNKKRAEDKAADEVALAKLEKRQRQIKVEKAAELATVTETSGIKDLAFDEEGNFIYQGTQAGMLSTSQIMRLSSELSALYPEGLGVELLDRGESLGKSVFDYVDRAKADELTILATIVGEAPAKAPAEVGVFVVEGGKVKPSVVMEDGHV